MEFPESIDLFNKPIIREKKYLFSNHKIFQKYTSEPYLKYSFELLQTLCEKSSFENKKKILHKSIYFLLKFLYKTRNNILISNYDIIILVSFYLGIKIVENQKIIPNLDKLKKIYQEKYGNYKNKEIKNAELIFIKLLGYKINFMTAYDYLSYLFKNNKELIDLQNNNLEKIIKENIQDYCFVSPISIIHDYILKAENNKLVRWPIGIKEKLVQQQKQNIYFNEFNKNKDESLSTSISSGYYNINHSNEIKTNYNNYKEINRQFSIGRIINKYIDNSLERSCEENLINQNNYLSNKKHPNNITINNNLEYGKRCPIFTYNKKNPKNLKKYNYTDQKVFKNEHRDLIFNFKNKILQRNNIPVCKLKLNFTNIDNKISNNSPIKLYSKPYFKKQGSKGCFTSNKTKEKELKFTFLNKIKNVADDFRFSLKKKLLFDE